MEFALTFRAICAIAIQFTIPWGLIVRIVTLVLSAFFAMFFETAAASTTNLFLDFDDAVLAGKSLLNLPGASVSNLDGGGLFIYGSGTFGMPENGGFCALADLESSDPTCKADALISFSAPVSNLSFESFFVSKGDTAIVRAMIGDFAVPDMIVSTARTIDLTVWSGITQVFIFDKSGSGDAGIAYGRFSYVVTTVPVPAGMPLLLAAIVLMGNLRARNRRS